MSDQVTLSVRSELQKIIDELAKVQASAEEVSKSLADTGKSVGDDLGKQTKKTETYFNKMRDIGRRSVDQLKKDFKSLLAVNALTESLKLSSQFSGSIKETVQLSDTIRKLGSTFGLASSQFSSFQNMLTKGLGQIGLSSEAGANALQGLAETPVRGQQALTEYAKTAGMLASISNQKGQEGDIAKGLSSVIVSRGGNVNDMGELKSASEDILRIRQATGKSATEAMRALSDLFSNSNPEFKKLIAQGGGVSMATAGLLGGQGATSFLERYLSLNKFERSGLEAQGLGKLIGQNGQLNSGAFASTIGEAKSRGQGDALAGLRTFGLSDEEAKGFMRLAEAIQNNGDVIEQARTKVVDLNQAYKQGMGLGESFRASINRVKGGLSGLLAPLTQGGTDMLQKASESNLGAGAVVAGGGALAALLAGYGLRGIGKGLGGGIAGVATGAAIEGATGRQVQPVYVVNAAEIGGAGALGGLAGKAGGLGLLGKAIPLAGAAATGYMAGDYLGSKIEKTEWGNKFYDKLADLLLSIPESMSRGGLPGREREMRLKIELNKQELKKSVQPTRGASYGP